MKAKETRICLAHDDIVIFRTDEGTYRSCDLYESWNNDVITTYSFLVGGIRQAGYQNAQEALTAALAAKENKNVQNN